MGQDVADYLTKAIIAGSVDNATLVYKGDPAHFPMITMMGNSKFMSLCVMQHSNMTVNGLRY